MEDAALVRFVGADPRPDWRVVAQLLQTRTPRQCRERYNNYLAPNIVQTEWTPEEERLLIEQYQKIGPQWKKMKHYFPNRTCVNIKNHWSKVVARGVYTGPKIPPPPDEDGANSKSVDSPGKVLARAH
jgi:hypothetical protein